MGVTYFHAFRVLSFCVCLVCLCFVYLHHFYQHYLCFTVPDKLWLHSHLGHFDDILIDCANFYHSKKTSKFGDSCKVNSQKRAIIPAQLCIQLCFIETEAENIS